MPNRLKELSGQRFGRLLVVGPVGYPVKWLCQCDCGNETTIRGSEVRKSTSCGCYRRSRLGTLSFKHGAGRRGKKAPEWKIWTGMRRRCGDADDSSYGGRGIRVCDRWVNGEEGRTGYECFLADLGPRPSAKYTIERSDNDGNYEPNNCRWATRAEQSRNRRSQRLISLDGRKVPVWKAAEITGLKKDVIYDRLRLGWTEKDALQTPSLPPFGGVGAARFKHGRERRA